jgi:putative glutamine amidotransferase
MKIGITSMKEIITNPIGHTKEITYSNQAYLDLVISRGMVPLIIPQSSHENVKSIVDCLDGIIFIGGRDIDPSLYSAVQQDKTIIERYGALYDQVKFDTKADSFELELYREAKRKEIPILGICRGMQLINIAEGGTLSQDLPSNGSIDHFVGSGGWINYHEIKIHLDTYIHEIFGLENYFTSSIHHQKIERLGHELKVSATAPDGVIEIMERVNKKDFIIGVQGHLEMTMKNLPLYGKLLDCFLAQGNLKRKFTK